MVKINGYEMLESVDISASDTAEAPQQPRQCAAVASVRPRKDPDAISVWIPCPIEWPRRLCMAFPDSLLKHADFQRPP